MRLLTFVTRAEPTRPRIGAMLGERIVDLAAAQHLKPGWPALPATMRELLAVGPAGLGRVRELLEAVAERESELAPGTVLPQSEIRWLPPIGDAEKFLCVGKNYRTHLKELEANDLIKEKPEEPTG